MSFVIWHLIWLFQNSKMDDVENKDSAKSSSISQSSSSYSDTLGSNTGSSRGHPTGAPQNMDIGPEQCQPNRPRSQRKTTFFQGQQSRRSSDWLLSNTCIRWCKSNRPRNKTKRYKMVGQGREAQLPCSFQTLFVKQWKHSISNIS